jgi:hypothetical protein
LGLKNAATIAETLQTKVVSKAKNSKENGAYVETALAIKAPGGRIKPSSF